MYCRKHFLKKKSEVILTLFVLKEKKSNFLTIGEIVYLDNKFISVRTVMEYNEYNILDM